MLRIRYHTSFKKDYTLYNFIGKDSVSSIDVSRSQQ